MSPLSQSLAALAQQRKLAGSLASLVRVEMPAIESARQAGLSYAQICQGFAALGIEASARTLRHTVYRIQAEQQRKALAAPPLPETRPRAAAAAPADPPAAHAPASANRSAPEALPEPQPAVLPSLVSAATDVLARAVEPVPSQPTAASPGARQPGPSPGFVRDIINTPIDMDEIARQYRSSAAARRAAASSAQAPPAAASQGRLPL